MKANQGGFTLVEIAIVLVIIGLLLGGILKGQELIVQARIKNIANDINGLSAAIYTYQDRYRAVPGDDKGACARWTGNTYNGNGSGDVDQATDGAGGTGCASGTAPKEDRLFWQHMRLAGLIGGDASSTDEPLNAAGGKLRVFKGPYALSGTWICATGLPAKIASAIDSQFDDGVPDKGAARGDEGDPKAAASTLTAYVDDPKKTYSVCKTL